VAGEREHARTVWIAFGANALLAVVKAAAGVLGGSSALLAEAAHSVADTSNQGLLQVSLKRSQRPPDEEHPFGYGKERFFWVLLAAVLMFLAGGVFSILEGLYRILGSSSEESGFVWSYAALGAAAVLEGISWVRAARQTRRSARDAGLPLVRFVRESKEPAVKAVASEDSAALAGVAIAFLGVGLHQATGDAVYDGAAAVAIGVLLCLVGVLLANDTKGLLLGEAARPELREELRDAILAHDEVAEVVELLTMYVGPESLLVAARLDLRDDISSRAIEELADAIERDLREAVPAVGQVFLDPTPGQMGDRGFEPRTSALSERRSNQLS
jgi:cation diffusion facilitator family transporter